MKVLFIGMVPLGSLGGDSMEAHVISALESFGVLVDYFPMYGVSRIGNRARKILELAMTDFHWFSSTPVERALLKMAGESRPDLVMVLLGNYTPPSTIQKLRKLVQAPVVCWCQDSMGTMGRQYLIGSRFDYLFAKDRVLVDKLRNFTQLEEVHYLPEACNPQVHTPVVPTADEMARFGCEVTTAGTLYYFRAETLAALSGFDMKVWGSVPKYYDGQLSRFCTRKMVVMRDKAACFNAAKIVLNPLSPWEIGGLNTRAFEVAGCGGFQLISESEALARHFEPSREVETFGNLDELQEKVRYYLAHDEARGTIAEAGRKRAHTEHTYVHRLKQMFDIMGMKLPVTEQTASKH